MRRSLQPFIYSTPIIIMIKDPLLLYETLKNPTSIITRNTRDGPFRGSTNFLKVCIIGQLTIMRTRDCQYYYYTYILIILFRGTQYFRTNQQAILRTARWQKAMATGKRIILKRNVHWQILYVGICYIYIYIQPVVFGPVGQVPIGDPSHYNKLQTIPTAELLLLFFPPRLYTT